MAWRAAHAHGIKPKWGVQRRKPARRATRKHAAHNSPVLTLAVGGWRFPQVAQLERRNSSESAFKAAATKLTNIKSAVAHLEERIKFNVAKAIEYRELAESYKQQAFDGMGGVASGTGWAADNEPNDPMAAQSSSGSGGAFSRPPERRRTIVLDLDELQRSQQLPVWFTTPITASVEATGSAEDGSR